MLATTARALNSTPHEQEEIRRFYLGDSGSGGACVPAVPDMAELRLGKTPAVPATLGPYPSRSCLHLSRLLSAGGSVEDLPSPRAQACLNPRTGCSHGDWVQRTGAPGAARRVDSALLDCAPRESQLCFADSGVGGRADLRCWRIHRPAGIGHLSAFQTARLCGSRNHPAGNQALDSSHGIRLDRACTRAVPGSHAGCPQRQSHRRLGGRSPCPPFQWVWDIASRSGSANFPPV